MEISPHILPQEFWAQVIVGTQVVLFALWLVFLLVAARRKRAILAQIDVSEDVSALKEYTLSKYSGAEAGQNPAVGSAPPSPKVFFDQFCADKIKKSSPLYKHLKAIFSAGYAESQIQTDALLNNTSGRINKADHGLRYTLSLFIILGLLGTLVGLAESLSQLSTVSLGNADASNESLRRGLEVLLGKLGGAFAPSICGVFLTVVGMLIFAAYLRWSTYPVLQRLEYETLTNWLPTLVPTPSQRAYEKLRLTEKTAQNVERLVETVNTNTGELAKNIQSANAALAYLRGAAGDVGRACSELNVFATRFARDLGTFSERFQTSVETLTPFSDSLARLYAKMSEESSQFQQTVSQTLNDSRAFREQTKEEFDRLSAQTQRMLESLKLYETAYLESRQTTDERLSRTLAAAETALQRLSQQSDSLVRGLIEAVGNPLREELVRELGVISTRSNEKLDEVTASSGKQLADLSRDMKEALAAVSRSVESVTTKLETIETPLKGTAESIATTARKTTVSMDATLTNFDSRTREWLSAIRQEFQTQNSLHERQANDLASLNENLGSLIPALGNLGAKLESFANRPIHVTRSNGGGGVEPPRAKRFISRLKFWG